MWNPRRWLRGGRDIESLNTPFKQQRLPYWQPLFGPKAACVVLLATGLAFLPLGLFISADAKKVYTKELRYDSIPGCPFNTSCSIPITIDEQLSPPVYFYYQLTKYYQNNRRYEMSRSNSQLRGDEDPELKTCDGFGIDDDYCGLIYMSRFNDSYVLKDPSDVTISWGSDGIAWKSDVEYKFADDFREAEGDKEEVIVWMRVAGLPTFRKLHRIYRSQMEPGVYTLEVDNFYPTADFEGTKSFIITTSSTLGGKNGGLAMGYTILGSLSIIAGFILLFLTIFRTSTGSRLHGDPSSSGSLHRGTESLPNLRAAGRTGRQDFLGEPVKRGMSAINVRTGAPRSVSRSRTRQHTSLYQTTGPR